MLSSWIERGVDGFHLVGLEYLARTADGREPVCLVFSAFYRLVLFLAQGVAVQNWPGIADVISDIKNHVDSFVNESTAASGKKM